MHGCFGVTGNLCLSSETSFRMEAFHMEVFRMAGFHHELGRTRSTTRESVDR